jgi:hypothetical protein
MPIKPGKSPDLSFYYDSNWSEKYYFSENPEDKAYNEVEKTPITANSMEPKENAIGFIAPVRYVTNGAINVENQSFFIQNWTVYLPEGTISFSPNSSYLEAQVFGNFAFGPGRTLWFKITSCTRNFLLFDGYVAIVTDPTPGTGRNVYVYFDK